MLKRHDLHPVQTLAEMRKRLELQPDEEGSLLAYLDKFHYPLWITQFYENLLAVSEAIAREAIAHNVRVLELRYSPVIHTYGGLTVRQAIRAILSGVNRAQGGRVELRAGLVVIAMRQHGPHIAKILARQAIAEAEHLHKRSGVVGFDIAGPERGNPPKLFRESFEIARAGRIGITAHAGEDAPAEYIWQAIDELGATRIGHGCSAIHDEVLLRRMAKDRILVECCPTSNYQTGAVERGKPHPILTFLDHGVPVAICTDNTTVSRTHQDRETALVQAMLGRRGSATVRQIHAEATAHSFIAAAREAALPRR
ncbi:MAG: hypothetical protein JRI23_05400 [Deltaproteobacteria bacterium]|jgi:adenosine deaminase|nr:hypothetical protein [Deltaproteobacteria bacterium]MBW2530988.1 hypothetical protein [Deltaproteobacteria bacterium]